LYKLALAGCLERWIRQEKLMEAFDKASKDIFTRLSSLDDMVDAYGRVFLDAREVHFV